MTKTSALALIASLAATLVITGCDDSTDCPAPVAEPAKTAATVASVVPKTSASPAADTAAKPAKKATPATVKVSTRPSDTSDNDVDSVDVDADLYVKRLVVAYGVDEREPVQATKSFTKGVKRIYAFVEVGNRDEAASEVFVSFKPKGGKELGRVRLRVGATPRWRTWAYTQQAKDVGEWEAIVRDASGEIIGRQTFEITEQPLSDDPYEDIDGSSDKNA